MPVDAVLVVDGLAFAAASEEVPLGQLALDALIPRWYALYAVRHSEGIHPCEDRFLLTWLTGKYARAWHTI